MIEPVDLICSRCKHFRRFEGGCNAFPDGIPDEIISTGTHDRPLPDQGNDIVFELDPASLTGNTLFDYYIALDSESASMVHLLLYATGSMERTNEILKRCQIENKWLYAYYPAIDPLSPEDMDQIEHVEPIGDIMDGCLYLVPIGWTD